ncbi:hypothetical protein LTS07_009258 [Exophiala sideris]|uniref:Uncharacterized protein n=1 Tax=Exophiala sideris TaxID=1016849 RepID=A0ABR0J104_9EURO|nr:hypothetical protein LTS07_009258 [Exophiala sideris]KAK5028242.1 hypothetical protein LTR13_009230 [Exophiala sideris]KAK5052900.1 hypothetical protein LTR69_009726 [Exophiala sideris]KAK5178511.1 hypothetical protein LTR44_009136 [Eurotiomycetes sp. CCFEE 6388]
MHELLLRGPSGRSSEQLRLLSSTDFAKHIRDAGSATTRPRDPEYGTHDPDSSFQHPKSPLSTVIIEVAHSQQGAVLRTLAEDYILGSDLDIRVVVGIDIEYSKNQRATFAVWRAQAQGPDDGKVWVVESTVADQVSLADFNPE